jgi:very-short-patch-repair endonuclease
MLGGLSALESYGLRGIHSDLIHVAAPKSCRPRGARGVRVHETRRLRSDDIATSALPRLRPAPAAMFAALWARSDREAALAIVAPVQQRITTAEAVAEALDRVVRHRRRNLLRAVVADVHDGAQSLGELDFARMCRRRGLPTPTRQRVVRLPSGRVYLDVCWDDFRLVVEIDGVQHLDVVAQLPDAFRQNEVTLDGRTVLRVPVLALRTDPEPFLNQVERALVAGGWSARIPSLRPTQGAQ